MTKRLHDYQSKLYLFDLPLIHPYNWRMRDWSLRLGDPLHLTLAADARLSKPDYPNDHIWEVELGSNDPERSAVGIATTFGSRARSMRLFLRFTEGGNSVTDPNTFASKPSLRRFYPNFLTLDFVPFENLQTTADFWVPESHSVAGRVTLVNKTTSVRNIQLEICAALAPLSGQSIVPTQQQLVNILAGQTSGIAPVIFMTGGPKHGPGPHASLILDLELGPGATRTISFAEAALDTIPEGFDLARKTAARPWQAELARIEMLDASQTIDIRTGDPDWDAALAFSQKAAHALFLHSEHLPHPSFVQARHSDHGHSNKGDGTDYPPAWNGQFVLDAYYLTSILNVVPQVAKNLILNFLSTQNEDGEVDGKPGIAGQRGRFLAMPILASMVWKYYQTTQDQDFLAEIFPKLVRFFWSWFSGAHDRNRDGTPEWDHILQTGLEDNPLFDVWNPWSQGMDVSFVHSPSLESMLYREALTLTKIAKKLGKPDEETALIFAQADKLKVSLDASWNSRVSFYSYRDRETGAMTEPKVIAKRKGDGAMRPKFESETPVRLLVEIQTNSPAAKRPEVEISEYFTKSKGETEVIAGHQFQWRTGGLVATTQTTFSRVGRISVVGLEETDKINIKIVDMTGEDITLGLPLWAGALEQQRAYAMIGRNIMTADRFDRPFGMPSMPTVPDKEAETIALSVSLPWNLLLAEGLIAYGFRAEATRLTAHIMNAIIQNLKQNRAFYQRYHAEKGTGIGERNSLTGFAPVGLVMQALGVTLLSGTRVKLEGRNLFPFAVTIKYKGMSIVRGQEQTTVTFANGESVIVKDEAPCIVEM
ncbi:MAG: MGH1-like glycoside hydrolase domain-containing protein [Chloroflexota bacterium]